MITIVIRMLFLSFALSAALLIQSADSRAQSIPGGSYKDTCRQISVVGGNLVAQCKTAGGDWHNSTLQYHDCSGDIRNDNGTLKCKHSSINPGNPFGQLQEFLPRHTHRRQQAQGPVQEDERGLEQYEHQLQELFGRHMERQRRPRMQGSGSGGSVPRGSYKNSCNDYYTEGNRLYASCKKKNGGRRDTSINYKNCNKDIWNDNGSSPAEAAGRKRLFAQGQLQEHLQEHLRRR